MHRARIKFIALAPLALLALAETPIANQDFAKVEADWRARREAHLMAPDGWLSVAGLFWMHSGTMKVGSDPQSDIVLPASAPRQLGMLQMAAGVVRFLPGRGAAVTINEKPAAKMMLKP